MQYSEAKLGRVLVVRLEHGDVVHECLEAVARSEGLTAAAVTVVGGADRGSRLVVGPRDGQARPVEPMQAELEATHEVAGVGTIFPNDSGEPILHLHMACGRQRDCTTGCARAGVRVWQVMEAILIEIRDTRAARRLDPGTGFELLQTC